MSTLLLAALTSTVTATAAPQIDLITIGVGAPMYAVFGHAALRVREADGTDTAYNFGGVDMTQPNFWLRLVRGRIHAYLDATPYSDLLLAYSAEDRTIVGRKLRFEPEIARAIADDLERIASTDERDYLYHHILDNCTTRVAELLDRHLEGGLSAQAKHPVEGTRRDWILERIRWKPWVYLAMDLTGNGTGDLPVRAWDTIFIPEALDTIVDGARFGGRPFVASEYLEYRSLSYSDPPLWDWPWLKVYLLFGLPLLLLVALRPRAGARVVGLVWGVLGLTYVGFWLFSDYAFYHANANLLVFPPTHLALLVAPAHRHAKKYLAAHVALLVGLVIGASTGAIVQAIEPMLLLALPIEALLLYRIER